ncbi:excinuclease Cho [Azotobacter vinelandii]|uniref:excinuclease Cho n=1 Tax=Azotobacter vinelandii TaxID=354 RepID=UPI000773C7CD|nr:excinuclease Cho [Azotobacter vinelandii]
MLPTKRPLRPAELYEYPEHLRERIASMPKAPGVYLFYGDSDSLPLYIGKSVDIRARLLAHLRTPEEARLLRQTRRIEHIRTAGEIGALLLESRLIKELQPLYNKRLRCQRRLYSIRLADGRPEVVEAVLPDREQALYGLFRSRRVAGERLLEMADRHRLCLGLLGLERHEPGRACFRTQIGRCAGACAGRESHEAHAARLLAALTEWQLFCWPYPGPVALHERGEGLRDYHVVDRWHFLGTYASLKAARKAPAGPLPRFDADSYQILLRPILQGGAGIVPLL